ncbi:MAG TPA: amidohydrolase family protein [Bauldia sp.]|nr:amidohydrolase family protein [Bauldia sp.]
MAEIPFIDTHFHLHTMMHPTLRYSWLERDAVHPLLGPIYSIKPPQYDIEDYIAEIRFSNVPKAIHVEAAVGTPDPVDETAWLQEMADKHGYPHGIVAEVHLAQPDAEAVIQRHLQYRNVRGVRDFGPGDYLINPDWQRGFRLLGKYNLVSCVDTRPERSAKLAALARSSPEVTVCVDHCAFPQARDKEYFEMWRRAMKELAEVPTIHMKVSGLGMRDPRWTVESIRPWVLSSIEIFGVDRIVFGTNWPVDRMFSSYPDLINAYAEIISGFSKDEQLRMFSANAEKLFRI